MVRARINTAGETRVGGELAVGYEPTCGRLLMKMTSTQLVSRALFGLLLISVVSGGVSSQAQTPVDPLWLSKALPSIPIVGVRASHPETHEPFCDPMICDAALPAPGVFSFSRRGGDLSQALSVMVFYQGTAKGGEDYDAPTGFVTFPAGLEAVEVYIVPHFDTLKEGDEGVSTEIQPDPSMGPVERYRVDPALAAARVVIHDRERVLPRLEILSPHEGQHFLAGEGISLTAQLVGLVTDGSWTVEFFDDQERIGRTSPGGTLRWEGAIGGSHTLRAVAQNLAGIPGFDTLIAEPIQISVDEGPSGPVVRIEATRTVAEESSFPFRRLALRGEFSIVRSGPTLAPLSVFVHYSGTSTPGVDVLNLPFLVTIPAGSSFTTLEVVPVNDGVTEGIETLVATLSHCPPDTDPPMGIPCFGGFDVDPLRGQATVFIRDDGITQASITVTAPASGQRFPAGESISIEATAVDLEGAITHVEFYDGETGIGESTILFDQQPTPGFPIFHGFLWRGASAGLHTLTVRGLGSSGERIISPPVSLEVTAVVVSPTVSVTTRDAFGVEPKAGSELDVAAFRIRRTGPLDTDLTVGFSLHGAAQNGVDYERIQEWVTLPKGRRSVLVTITPIQDGLRERRETVSLQLEGSATDQFPPSYIVGTPARAIALISDEPWAHDKITAECVLLPEGFAHLCFLADPLLAYRVEASSDLSSWEAIFHGVPVGDALHAIDDRAAEFSHRYYRLVVEAAETEL